MATYIENQPIFLGTEDVCLNNNDFVYNQIVDNNDVLEFQLKIEACENAEQLNPDPYFEHSADWIIGDNITLYYAGACWVGNTEGGLGNSTLTTSNTTLLTNGSYYQFSIEVFSITGGGLTIRLGGNDIGTVYTMGVFTFYGNCIVDSGFTGLIIYPSVDGVNACISNVFISEVDKNFIVAFYDLDGNYITQINYNDNPTEFFFYEDTVTVSIDWNDLGLQNGCFYFCVLDPCINTNGQNHPATILNQGLDWDSITHETTNWELGKYEWTSNVNFVTANYLGYGECLSQYDVFPSYTNNCVTITVTRGTDINLEVYFGDTFVGTITSIGTFTFCGIPSIDLNLYICIMGGSDVNITSVTPISKDDYVCDFTSNTFKVGDYADDCTILVQACNNENGMGFTSTFVPTVRLDAKLIEPKYENERNTYTDSKGKKSIYYFKGRKQKNFVTDLQPEYILDFLWTLFGFDNVYLNGIKYSVDDDEFTPEYVFDSIGKVKFLVSKREQDVKNTNCSNTENNCIKG